MIELLLELDPSLAGFDEEAIVALALSVPQRLVPAGMKERLDALVGRARPQPSPPARGATPGAPPERGDP